MLCNYLSNLCHILIGGCPAHGARASGLDDIPHICMYYMQTVYDCDNVSVYME